jgi:type VI protein secretion system component Hcp
VAFDIFLKLTDSSNTLIKGDSTTKGHEDEIEVRSFSWGESRDAGITDPHEMAFVTPVSLASPAIAKLCADGTALGVGQISVNAGSLKGGTGELLMIKLATVTLGSYQLGIADTDPEATDRFTLAFQHMEITKRRQNPDGSIGTASLPVVIDFPPPAP